MKGLKTLKSSIKYSGEISLRLDKFILDGKSIEKEIVLHRNSVGILPLFKSDKNGAGLSAMGVILVSQYRRAADSLLLEIPAGKLEDGETPLQAAERELAEEIGFKAGSLEPILNCFLAPGYDTEYMTIFLAKDLTQIERGKLDDDENIKIRKISFNSALKKCFTGEIRDCKTIAALSAYAALTTSEKK